MRISVSVVRNERVVDGSNVLFHTPPRKKYDLTIYDYPCIAPNHEFFRSDVDGDDEITGGEICGKCTN